MVRDPRLELGTSATRMRRATDCASPCNLLNCYNRQKPTPTAFKAGIDFFMASPAGIEPAFKT